jgi:Exopolysaccharide synthesis, ExoD
LHLLWVLLVASGWAQPLMDFVFWLHCIRPVYVIEGFDPCVLRAWCCSLRRSATQLVARSPSCGTTSITHIAETGTVCGRAANPGAVGGPRLSDELVVYAKTVNGERVTFSTLVGLMGRRSITFLLLFLALPMALPIPAPGISVLFGLPLIVISAQLAAGRHRAWLPERLARQSMPRDSFVVVVERALPTLRRLERIVRPRLGWLAGDWTMAPSAYSAWCWQSSSLCRCR